MRSIEEIKRAFPRSRGKICMNHCRISPTYRPAAEREAAFALGMADGGTEFFLQSLDVLPRFRRAAANLLGTLPENISLTKSSSEGLNLIAHGFRWSPGDEIISFEHECPSNHYPWRAAEMRSQAVLKLLPDRDVWNAGSAGGYCGWTLEDLDRQITSRTRIVAVSHVQFISGFSADLEALAKLCRSRGVHLVLDAAQSLGCLPIDVEALGISALVASGWKWLLGPMGAAVMYTSPQFRSLVDVVFPGGMSMKQRDDLDLTWNPDDSSGKFNGSAAAMSLAASLAVCLEELFSDADMEAVAEENFRLQSLVIDGLAGSGYRPLCLPQKHRSGILAVVCPRPPEQITAGLSARNIVASSRGPYLRLAPHFYNSPEEMGEVVRVLLELAP